MRVLFAVSEAVPFAKTGGLADVAGALPRALRALGVDVRVVLPRYRQVDGARHHLEPVLDGLPVPLGGRVEPARVFAARGAGDVPVYFIACDRYFDREGLYQAAGKDYPDNAERFAFFSRAVLELARALDFRPDLFHCQDWETGLVPVYLRALRREDPALASAVVLFTIHNLAYQGLSPAATLPTLGLAPELFTPAGLEFYAQVSLMKAGIVFADRLSTVSRRYSREIQTPEFGCGLDGVLRERRRDLRGILNGIDVEEWNPATDPHLAARYAADDLAGKAVCKAALQRAVGLAPDTGTPLFAAISRLAEQKGMDQVADAVKVIREVGGQFVLLGAGDPALEDRFRSAAAAHPGRVATVIGYDAPLAHRIAAGADFLLMPSRYEPCGLNQLYGLRYGTIPIVRATGGLDDTVAPFDAATGEGTGIKFEAATADALHLAIYRAAALHANPAALGRAQANGMRADFSWDRSARAYEALYREMAPPGGRGQTPAGPGA
jgi:starch synthase